MKGFFKYDKSNQIIEISILNKVEKAFLFGSSRTDKFNENSDLDIIVKFSDKLDVLEYGEYW